MQDLRNRAGALFTGDTEITADETFRLDPGRRYVVTIDGSGAATLKFRTALNTFVAFEDSTGTLPCGLEITVPQSGEVMLETSDPTSIDFVRLPIG